MFKLFRLFSQAEVAIDLGTSRTRVYLKGKGVLIDEPTVLAINTRSDQIIALGDSALKMEGKTPPHILISRPIGHGIVVDFEIAEKLVKNLLEKIFRTTFYSLRPKIFTSLPEEITEVEKKSLEDIMWQVGARKVFLVERPVAAGIGCKLPIKEPTASLIVEAGAGLTEIAVVSLSGIVSWRSLKIGGENFDQSIINYTRDKYGVLLGKSTAEEVKIKIGSILAEKPQEAKVKGKDLATGLPREIILEAEEIKTAILPQIKLIIQNIRETIESTPAELVADIYERGLVLSGGVSLLDGFKKMVEKEIKTPVHLAAEPCRSVIYGLGYVLEDFNNLKEVLAPLATE